MKKIMTRTWCLALCLAAVAWIAACTRPAEARRTAEIPTLDVTSWTDKTELFMEYPPLVAGEEALFAVHLTRLSDFSAMTTGRPRLEFTPESGGAPATLPGAAPSRPGVYRVLGAAPPAGRYRWQLVIETPDLTDRHDLGAVTIFADQAAAVADAEGRIEEDPAAITYLKEPQWTIGFGTVTVQDAELRQGIRVPAIIEPLTGGEAIVSAPAAGRFMTERLLAVGDRVTAGQEVGVSNQDSARVAPTVPPSRPPWPRRRPRSTPPAWTSRAPNACWPNERCLRDGSRRPSALSGSPSLASRRRRPGCRSAMRP